PETWIPFQLKEDSEVTVTIFDLGGKAVRVIPLGLLRAGDYTTRSRAPRWDGRNDSGESVSSGLYICTIRAGTFTSSQRMILLR
ncbi:MAG: FlgD immunoglobulin-like domain containing protein, partial [Patescibacteria group bacterium]